MKGGGGDGVGRPVSLARTGSARHEAGAVASTGGWGLHLGQAPVVSAPCACHDQSTHLVLGMPGQAGPARPPSHPPS
eukprot:2559832-Amphidinium_carterae.2